MEIFDFNVHLPTVDEGEQVEETIGKDLKLSEDELIRGFQEWLKSGYQIKGANFQLFNTSLFQSSIDSLKQKVQENINEYLFTALVNYRSDSGVSYIDRAKAEGSGAIMFNSYLQKIPEQDYFEIVELCKYAESKDLIICIDGSYGTSKMYTYFNLPLICKIADQVSEVPIVIIHSGGSNIINSMHLAMEKDNVYLETSYSLNFYLGSSLEKDYAFAYKKIGASKVLFGSDYPYHDYYVSLENQLSFFQKFDFTDKEIEKIMYKNALRLIDG